MLRRLTRAALGALLTLAACTPAPLAWNAADERRVPIAAPTAAAPTGGDALADSLLVAAMQGAPPCRGLACPGLRTAASLAALPADAAGTLCPASIRWAAGRRDSLVAVWWAARPDGSAALRAAYSPDRGRTWGAPLRVDSLDRSGTGCDRPAPSVAVDSVNGYVHVAYALAAPEGKGVFYAHQMDPRAAFEVPQAIVYGDRPAFTDVSSDGDRVLIAYEDPNTGGRPFISVAISRTGGHTWTERVAASEGSVSAERPRVVVHGRAVLLGWVERAAPRTLETTEDPRSATTPYPTGLVVRWGTIRE